MAYVGTKGYYVKKLKEHGVRTIDRKSIKKYKTHILANLLDEITKENNTNK